MAASRPVARDPGLWAVGTPRNRRGVKTMETTMAKKSRRTPKSAATAAINGNPASGDPSAKPTALAGLDPAAAERQGKRQPVLHSR